MRKGPCNKRNIKQIADDDKFKPNNTNNHIKQK